ncbi:hypothetical protein CLV84_3734 [Neolewinella xylanilytica]|uniref:Secreted protein n=1 Tax=Neolewinella xylanilytica TaxID=1514080 RepID=A0A2S6I0T3_9BACT|nr:hypothetical protein [Neolewinella xylanilytica]PPK84572.1 hypothetical protein CLV84_3734 [Neolewinella xylanilytica]
MYNYLSRGAWLLPGALLLSTVCLAQRGGKPGPSTEACRAAEVFTTLSVPYGRIEFRMRAAAGSGVIPNFFTWKEGAYVLRTAYADGEARTYRVVVGK